MKDMYDQCTSLVADVLNNAVIVERPAPVRVPHNKRVICGIPITELRVMIITASDEEKAEIMSTFKRKCE